MSELIKKIISTSVVIFALSMLAILPLGCGGGGGASDGGGNEDGNGTPADTTPPEVVSVLPVNGSTDVATNTAISVTFSEDMDPSTINENTVTVSSSAGTLSVPRNLSGAVSYADKIATFSPTADLPFSTTVTITVTTGVTDLAGNALAAAYVFTFSTGTEPDTTPPAIEDTSGDEDEKLDPHDVVSVAFSEPVDPATLTSDNIEIMIRGYNIMELIPDIMDGFELDSSGTVLSFEPPDGLARNAEYTVTLGTGITDTAGNPLDSEFTWTFRTRAGTWGSPETLFTESSYNPANPRAGFDSGGKAQVLWSAYYDGPRASAVPYATYSKRYDVSQSPVWGADIMRSIDSSGSNTHTVPAVGSNRAGTVAASWFGNWVSDDIFGEIFTSGDWTGEEQVSSSGETGSSSASAPSVAVDMQGNVFTVWIATYDPDGSGTLPNAPYLLARRYDAENGGLDDYENISALDGGPVDTYDIGCDPDGNAVALWEDPSENRVKGRLFDNSGGWSSVIMTISSEDLEVTHPDIGADGNGNAVAVYCGTDGENEMICANRYVEGTGDNWDDESQVVISSTDPYPNNCSESDIAVDFASGDAVAVWSEWRGGDYHYIVAALYEAASNTWKTPRDITTGTSINPKVVCDFAGNFFIYWFFEGTLYARTYRLGDQWSISSFSDPQAVAEGLGELDNSDMHLCAGPNGRAIAVWINDDSVEANVFE